MNAFDRERARARAGRLAIALPLTLLLLSSTAGADIGFESASRSSAAPGEQLKVTVGCGFCFPPCVGRPGHRHPPGGRDGVCMLGGRPGPPAGFGIWLTPAAHRLDRNRSGSSRPPHLPSFAYLGRAERVLHPKRHGPQEIPRYVLRFRVPRLPPGRYEYVLYCPACVEGPRGSLVESVPGPVGRLRVAAGAAPSGGDARALIAGVAAAAIAVPALGLLVRRRPRT
ncbi:MAG TPA: hypothetical protein VH476_03880 [Solirubrobacterales bacterium]|jgi:hypothetical protein